MSDSVAPYGTTLLLKGAQVLVPAGDWHDPVHLDIALPGTASPVLRRTIALIQAIPSR
jgi:hypothetical protein